MSLRYKCPFIKRKLNLSAEVNPPTKSDSTPKESLCYIRVRKELSLKEKLEILKRYDGLPKMSQRSAAVQLNISQPVLCKILKNRNFIENIMLTNENSVRKRTRGGKEREIESALKLWYVEVQRRNIPINGQIIREKAKELGKQMGKEFAATDGWFTRWRKRENIVYDSIFRRKARNEVDLGRLGKGEKNNLRRAQRTQGKEEWTNIPPTDKVCDSQEGVTLVSHNAESESKVPEESQKWEAGDQNMCQVFIKAESNYDSEEEKPVVTPPTDEEMLEALTVLSAGVKHRTRDLKLHYEYEHFINQLLEGLV